MKTVAHAADPPQQQNFRVKGERHPNASLTEAQVRAMRKEYADALRARDATVTMKSLADKYGVVETTVQRIISRRLWKHI